jgi:hypothetical protein
MRFRSTALLKFLVETATIILAAKGPSEGPAFHNILKGETKKSFPFSKRSWMIFLSESRSFFLKVCKVYQDVRIFTSAGLVVYLHLANFTMYCSRAIAIEGALGVGACTCNVRPASFTALAVVDPKAATRILSCLNLG